MDLLPDEEQEQIVLAIGKLLAERLPIARVREIGESGGRLSDEDWQPLAEMGLFSLMLEENHGGAGYGIIEGMLAFREVGRHLTPGPLLGTALAAWLLADAGHGDAADFGGGTYSAALAEPSEDPDAHIDHGPSGRFRVFSLPGATHVLFVASDDWSLVPAADLHEAAVARPSIDPSVPFHLVTSAAGNPITSGSSTTLTSLARVLVAAELCGVAEAVQAASTAYASQRQQFGKPIGSFQAVKHRCVDMAIRSEAAWSQTVYAALAVTNRLADGAMHATAAKLLASDAANSNAIDNIQNHGGIGFTAELDAHLYLRRARALEHTNASTSQLADAMALAPTTTDLSDE
jgi:alkylation response protein AidB-like acyl-CoA dehydrogenase